MKEPVQNYRYIVGENAEVQSVYLALLAKCDDDMVVVRPTLSIASDCGVIDKESGLFGVDYPTIEESMNRLKDLGLIEQIDDTKIKLTVK